MESQDIAIGIVVSVVLGVLLVLILKKIAFFLFSETLHFLCSKGDIWYVKRHLDKGSDVNAKDEDGVTPLQYAAEVDYNEIVELLIDKGANVNAKNDDGATPLDVAIQFKELETAALLRKHGGKHETVHSADVSDEDGSTHRNFVYWFLWFILGVINLAILIYLFVA
jgi:ankyrin repeat protein